MKIDTINLEKWFYGHESLCVDGFAMYTVKDFTKYKVEGVDEYSIEFDPKVAKWISLCDVDIEEFDIADNDEYYFDKEDGILLFGAYCGTTEVKILNSAGDIKTICLKLSETYNYKR